MMDCDGWSRSVLRSGTWALKRTLFYISNSGAATLKVGENRSGLSAAETTRRPHGLRGVVVSGLGRLYGTVPRRPRIAMAGASRNEISQPPQPRFPGCVSEVP